MRIRVFAPSAALLFALATPFVLHAQFQEPTKEELQMTADPQAPGAAAVYLYREERTDDTLHYHGLYVRMKILTEKGKEAATVHIPYEHGMFKVTDIQGRTIHRDGTVIPLTAKPSDLVDVKNAGYQVNDMVFTLPSVEVGSIIEYRLQIRYDDQWISSPNWQIQQPYYVHKAHYFFLPSQYTSQLLYAFKGKPDTKLVRDALGRFTYDVEDVPAFPKEDWMPPTNSLIWRIHFYYSSEMNGSDFWGNASKRWAKEADRFANPNGAMREAAAQLVLAGDSDEVKARKIYAAVQALDNTSFSRTKSQVELKAEGLKANKDAKIVWEQKSGSANDLALLYVALARAAGLKVYPMEVVDRNRAIFDANFLSTGQLDDYIAALELNGKEVFLDPGQKMCPFGLLAWKHTLAGGIRDSEKGPNFGVTPGNIYTQNVVERVGDVTINPDGSMVGSLRFIFTGQDALYWRQMALRNDTDEVQKRFTEWAHSVVPDGVVPEMDHFLALNDASSNLVAMVKVHGSMGTSAGKHYFVPGVFFESRARNSFAAEDKRQVPVDVHYAKRVIDQVTYRVPAGFTIESAPAAGSVPWQGTAIMKIQSKMAGNAVTVTRDLAYNFTLVDPKEYGTLHDFYQKVDAADQQQIALVRAQGGGAVGGSGSK